MKKNVTKTSSSSTSATTAITTISTSDITDQRKIESATEGLPSSECFNLVHNRVLPANKENALIICD